MKKGLAALLCLLLLAGLTSASAADINFVTAGTQGTFYAVSVAVAKLWNEHIPGMRAVATPSGGGVDNLNQALEGEAQIGIANANLVYQAMTGTDVFEGAPNENIRIFAGLYYNPNQVVVTQASGIGALEDLKGRHISVGAAGSTTIDEAARHLETAGLTLGDVRAEYLDVASSADAIQNRQLEGAWIMAGAPNAAVTQLLAGGKARLLPILPETVEKLREKYPWYAAYSIPAGTYDGQGEDVPTSAVKLTLFIAAQVDEETAYQMTRVFWEHWDELTDSFAALRAADPREACLDLAGVPLHEGCARYYREIGLLAD